jgi:hypothetical protein
VELVGVTKRFGSVAVLVAYLVLRRLQAERGRGGLPGV